MIATLLGTLINPPTLSPETNGHARAAMESLKANQTWSTSAHPGRLQIRCVSGQIWMTQALDSRDIILQPGESYVCKHLGKVVLQALCDAEFEVTHIRN